MTIVIKYFRAGGEDFFEPVSHTFDEIHQKVDEVLKVLVGEDAKSTHQIRWGGDEIIFEFEEPIQEVMRFSTSYRGSIDKSVTILNCIELSKVNKYLETKELNDKLTKELICNKIKLIRQKV